MSASFKRKPLTDLVLSTLATVTNFPVGDVIAPLAGGWQGQPNNTGSNFVPYSVVVPGMATKSWGGLKIPQSDWILPYTVWAFGVRRDQCEALADLCRSALEGLSQTTQTLASVQYRVLQIFTESIGAVQRFDSTDPPYYSQCDNQALWLSLS